MQVWPVRTCVRRVQPDPYPVYREPQKVGLGDARGRDVYARRREVKPDPGLLRREVLQRTWDG